MEWGGGSRKVWKICGQLACVCIPLVGTQVAGLLKYNPRNNFRRATRGNNTFTSPERGATSELEVVNFV